MPFNQILQISLFGIWSKTTSVFTWRKDLQGVRSASLQLLLSSSLMWPEECNQKHYTVHQYWTEFSFGAVLEERRSKEKKIEQQKTLKSLFSQAWAAATEYVEIEDLLNNEFSFLKCVHALNWKFWISRFQSRQSALPAPRAGILSYK